MNQRRVAILRFTLDALCVLIFVIVGRRNHEQPSNIAGTLRTALPFLIALTGAWVGANAWRAPRSLVVGAVLWLVTVVVGLGMRRFAFGDGIALPFVIVTTVLLGLLLVGTRLPKRIKR